MEVEFIKEQREKRGKIGKEKIKPLLDKYCKEHGLKSISESTIGNIIKRHNFFFQRSGRIYHDPDSGYARRGEKKEKRLRVRYSPKPEEFGHIMSDTVERVTDGIKDYFYSAIDTKMKFVLTLNFRRLTSRNMKGRPHKSPELKSPLEYLIQKGVMSQISFLTCNCLFLY